MFRPIRCGTCYARHQGPRDRLPFFRLRRWLEHPRATFPDDVLKLVAKNGGVVMVNFYSGFITPEGARAMKAMFEVGRELRKKYPVEQDYKEAWGQWRREHPFPPGSVHDVVDQYREHIIQVAGIDHVGLGSDYDGIGSTPRQLEDVSCCHPYITQELLNRGHQREAIHKVLGGTRCGYCAQPKGSPRK